MRSVKFIFNCNIVFVVCVLSFILANIFQSKYEYREMDSVTITVQKEQLHLIDHQ